MKELTVHNENDYSKWLLKFLYENLYRLLRLLRNCILSGETFYFEPPCIKRLYCAKTIDKTA